MKSPNRRFLVFTVTTAATCGIGRVLLGAMALTCANDLVINTNSSGSARGDALKTITAASSTTTYTITGATANKSVTVTLPSSVVMTGPGSSISATNFTRNPTTLTTDGSGGATFTVGARRPAVPAAQAAGHYSGAITMKATVNGTQKTDTSCTVETDIIASIGITKVNDLDFGDSAPNDPAYVMSPSVAPSRGGSPTRGQFNISGQANSACSVTISPSSVTMTTGNGSGAIRRITANAFTYYSTSAASSSSAQVGSGGTDTLYLAGTQAAINASQVAGAYVSPNITVTVTYQ